MNEIVFLNNRYIPKTEASISINDRGFHFGDGVYEVIKYYTGKSFMMDGHIQRLTRSLKEVRINFEGPEKLIAVCENLIRMNHLENKYAGIYLQITRGSHTRMHAFPEKITPTVCAEAFEMPPRKENLEYGIKVVTKPDIRWLRCDIKSVSLIANVLMIQEAVEQGAGECILVRNGVVTEATHSSVLAVQSGRIKTHPRSNLILPGITKEAVKEICLQQDIPFEENSFTLEELYQMDELFLAGTGNEIMPVTMVDSKKISDGNPGKVTRTLQKLFFELTYEKLSGDKWWQF
ncbi:MAG: D-amino-acid transaminase [Bacteroidales bacterium]|nr:D-amino-acid transaminase [Bacteroidales bacterium]